MPNSVHLDELLRRLAECPPDPTGHAQIDETITPRLAALIGKSAPETAVELKKILDDCAYYALASDFGMVVMNATWIQAKAEAAE